MKNTPTIATSETAILIGEKYFDDDDQMIFARLSGDRNPVHTDDLMARRYLTGQKVAYGIHVLLWALEYWFARNTETPQTIKCIFKNPIHLGEKVVFFQEKNKTQSIIRIYVDDLLCMKITLLLSADNNKNAEKISALDSLYPEYILLKTPDLPLDPVPAAQVGKKYRVLLPAHVDTPDFPQCTQRLGHTQISAICSLSFFMGMVCPGLHSLLSGVSIDLCPSAGVGDELFYSIDNYDPRFDLFFISVRGVIAGEMTVFKRPTPVAQDSLASLSARVQAGEFSHTHSLIIGGSRGLGEYTAKLLVAGGGHVILTYAQGLADAQRLCDELNAFRRGSCKIQKYNVLNDPLETLAPDEINLLTAVYYFATPKIFRRKSEKFNQKIFDEFCSVYVAQFDALCSYLDKTRKKTIRVFLPSSVAITDTPATLAEYAAAKLAAELRAEQINQAGKHVEVIVSRLPRLDTDQTATLPRVPAASTLETMLPLIRQVSRVN